jgi:hypothetical protein
MLSSGISTSATSRRLKIIAKLEPEPVKGDSWSVIPFVCASPAECIFLAILRVMLVSVESGVEYENMPSYASPDFVVIVIDVPLTKQSAMRYSKDLGDLQ